MPWTGPTSSATRSSKRTSVSPRPRRPARCCARRAPRNPSRRSTRSSRSRARASTASTPTAARGPHTGPDGSHEVHDDLRAARSRCPGARKAGEFGSVFQADGSSPSVWSEVRIRADAYRLSHSELSPARRAARRGDAGRAATALHVGDHCAEPSARRCLHDRSPARSTPRVIRPAHRLGRCRVPDAAAAGRPASRRRGRADVPLADPRPNRRRAARLPPPAGLPTDGPEGRVPGNTPSA